MALDEHHPRVTRRRRVWITLPALLVLLIAAAASALWLWRLPVAEYLLARAAEAANVELHAVSMDRLDFHGADMSNLQFGPEGVHRIARLQVTWTVARLLQKRVEEIEISGADIQSALSAGGKFTIEGIPHVPERGDRQSEFRFPAGLPFRQITVGASQLAVSLPDGVIDIRLNGSAEVSSNALRAEVTAGYTATTRRGQGRGSGRASLEWRADGAPLGDFELAFDRLITADLTGTGIRLSGRTGGLTPQPEALSLYVEGRADAIETNRLTASDVRVDAELADGVLDLIGSGQVVDWQIQASGQLRPFDLTAPAQVAVKAAGDAATLAGYVEEFSAAGAAAIELDAEIADPSTLIGARGRLKNDPLAIADLLSARLSLQADVNTVAVTGVLAADAVAGGLEATWRRGMLDVDIREGARASGVVLAADRSRKLAAFLPDLAPFDVVLATGMASPPAFRLTRNGDRAEIRAVGGVRVELPVGRIVLEGDGGAVVNARRGVERFEIPILSVVFDRLSTTMGVAQGDLLLTGLSDDGEGVSGVVDGEASISDIVGEAFSARRLVWSGSANLGSAGQELIAVMPAGAGVTLRDVRLPGAIELPGETRLKLGQGRHRLSFDRRRGVLSGQMRLAPGAASVRARGQQVELAYGPAMLSGTWPGRAVVEIGESRVALGDAKKLALRELRLRAEGELDTATISLAANGLWADLPGLALPVFDGRADLARRADELSGTVVLTAVGGQPMARMQIAHDIAAGQGRASNVEARIRFAPGVLQPTDIRPALGDSIKNVFAEVALDGAVDWSAAGGLRPDLLLKIDDLAFSSDKFELFDARAALHIVAAPLLETPSGQRFEGLLRVGRLEPVPLSVLFQLRPDPAQQAPSLIVERLTTQAADGTLTTDPFAITLPSLDTDVTVHVDNADIARLFSVLSTTRVGGTGRVDGAIPITVRGSKIGVTDGRLSSRGPGTIFYDIDLLPPALTERGDTVSLALKALSSFNYDELDVELAKSVDGPGMLMLRLKGANPEVLDNQPFNFNIGFESDFDRLAALVLEGLATSQGLLRALALSAGNGLDPAAAR